jgi:hypothetical protein
MSAIWEHAPQKGAELIVLLALADWANDRGECDPSYGQLAEKARVDRRRAIRLVSKLINDKAITVDGGQGFSFGKQGTSNRITVVAPVPPGGTDTTGGSGLCTTGGSGTGTTRGSGAGATHNGQQQRSTTTVNNNDTPPTPTSPAGNPGGQVAERQVPTRGAGSTATSRAPRSPKSDRAASPAGESEARGGRWAPVAAAIMGAIGRPAPRGKLPSWLGNAVATFGAAAGDDPAAAMVLVAGWAKSRPLREALERGIVRDHTVPAMVGSWIAAGNGGQPPAGVAQKADPQALRMQRLGAPDNWRELVYTHDGTKRSPVLALPRLGLEPYAPPATWPSWYRAFEGVEA